MLVLELGPSHFVAPVPLAELVEKAGKTFGTFPDLLRNREGQAIARPEEWSEHRDRRRAAIREALGLPAAVLPCPLEPRIISEEAVPARMHVNGLAGPYVRRKVSIQLRPGERTSLWLLIPPGLGPFPAVVACHQTVTEGKDEPAGLSGNVWQLNYGPFLASRGLVVAAADSPAFGERVDPLTETPLDTTRFEARDPRWSLLGQRLLDHSRVIDYLETLPFVSRGKIGAIGHSLGGESVTVLAAMDERIKAAVVSCGFTLLRSLENAGETYAPKGHAILPRSLRPALDVPIGRRQLPFDFDDFMLLWPPRPVFYHEVRDELPQFTTAGQTLQAAAALRRVYAFHRAEDRYYLIVSAQAHCFPAWVQADAFDWLLYWLGD